WLGLSLAGAGRSNRSAYGALVTVEAGGRKLTRHCHSDGSYLSSSDPRVHVGLGAVTCIERVTIRWSDGRIQTRVDPPLDRYLRGTEDATGRMGSDSPRRARASRQGRR